MKYNAYNVDYLKLTFGDVIKHADCDLRFICAYNKKQIFEVIKVKQRYFWAKKEKLLIYNKKIGYEIMQDQDIINGEEIKE